MSDRLDLRADAGPAGAEQRSGVRLSRIKGGERTWQLTLVDVADAAMLCAIVRALVELDRELENAYAAEGRPAPVVHPPGRELDDQEEGF